MPSPNDKEDVEATVALDDHDLKAITGDSLPSVVFDDQAVTHQRPPRTSAVPPPPPPRPAPAAYVSDDEPTHDMDAARLPPPTETLEPAENPTPLIRSRIEQPIEPDLGGGPPSALAPISRFPPASTRPPSVPAPASVASATKPPSWVYAYLALCATLTLIGLIVLFFERKMLGPS